MARGDYRYLIQPRGAGTNWYAAVEVPRTLREVLGKKRLVRSLKTDDIRLARIGRWSAVEEMKAEIAGAKGLPVEGQDRGLTAEALAFREELAKVSAARRDDLMYAIAERAEQIDRKHRGRTADQSHDHEEATTSSKGAEFAKVASGQATPVDYYVERWLTGSGYSERTKADARTALARFKAWCSEPSRTGTIFIETVTDRIASDFRDEAFVETHVHTANKKLSALRQYWQWLDKSFGVKPNPWAGKSLAKPRAHRVDQDGPQGSERPFTDDEVIKLLNSDADKDRKRSFSPI